MQKVIIIASLASHVCLGQHLLDFFWGRVAGAGPKLFFLSTFRRADHLLEDYLLSTL